jgi:hypothetical protein
MLNDTSRVAQPTHACMKCGHPAPVDAATCTECGSREIALSTTRDSNALVRKRSASAVSGVIVLLQSTTLAFLCIFDFSTFKQDSFMVRDAQEWFAAIGIYCLASAAGMCLLPLRAVPAGMKILALVLTVPLLWEVLRLCLLCALGIRLPGMT